MLVTILFSQYFLHSEGDSIFLSHTFALSHCLSLSLSSLSFSSRSLFYPPHTFLSLFLFPLSLSLSCLSISFLSLYLFPLSLSLSSLSFSFLSLFLFSLFLFPLSLSLAALSFTRPKLSELSFSFLSLFLLLSLLHPPHFLN